VSVNKINFLPETLIILLIIYPGMFIRPGDQLQAQSNLLRRIEDIPVTDSAYQRVEVAEVSDFGHWLRQLALKPVGSPVLSYKGKVRKTAQDTTVAAVISLDIQGRRQEQCMDILIRLYAEYLWQNSSAEGLSLPLPSGVWLSWPAWREGLRPEFHGVQVKLKHQAEADSSFQNYENYLRLIYSESHTQQFYHGLKPIDRQDLKIGDFIVSRGSKSHAVMIVDLARNKRGQLVALIGHGDTPACEFYLLNYRINNPWFPINFEQEKLPLPVKKIMNWAGLRRFMQR
jgi:hypothetical protein